MMQLPALVNSMLQMTTHVKFGISFKTSIQFILKHLISGLKKVDSKQMIGLGAIVITQLTKTVLFQS